MKRIILSVIAMACCLLPQSCNKGGNAPETKTAGLSVSVKNAQELYEVPKSQTASLELVVAANPVSSEAYTISLAPNTSLVASYNTEKGTSYEVLPATAYQLASTSVILPKFAAQSSACELRLTGEGCTMGVTYVLPIAIEGVKGGTNFEAPTSGAAYILFKQGEPKAVGSGTKDDPYTINGIDTFNLVASLLKDDSTIYFKLTGDVDFSGVQFTEENPWVPINNAANDDAKALARARKIVFDGNGHKIVNFKAGGPIFGTVCGAIENLTVENAEITGESDDAAVLVAIAGNAENAEDFIMKNVTVKNSKVDSDHKRAGSIIAYLVNGQIENCVAECPVHGQQQAGGLIGRVEGGSIIGCSATGEVNTETYYPGGLIGYVIGNVTVKNCYATGNATSASGSYTRGGGLIGQVDGNATIEKCYATGNVSGQGHMAGGLIGVIGKAESVVTISKCYATGNVTLPTGGNFSHAGGLVGTINAKDSEVNISDSYCTGAISVRRYSSGFVGSIYGQTCKLNITNSYTTSDISGIALADRCGVVLGNTVDGSTITCKGFVAWNVSDRPFSYSDAVSTDGNYYGTEGTVSTQAKALGWNETIWDLSANEPKLK